MTPLVSVIIPTYNRLALTVQALESVFNQTYRPIHVIVVDDGSTDGTVEYLLATEFPLHIDVLALSTNQGPGAARNAGINCANGKYVAFLDSDDSWLPHKLECQVALLEERLDPENVFVHSQQYIRRQYETLIQPNRAKRREEQLADYMFINAGHIHTSNVILSTAIARKVKYKSDMRLHEDWDFYLRLEELGIECLMYPEPLTISNDCSRLFRASNPQPTLSLRWLEIWRGNISRSAYLALRAKMSPQLRSQHPLRALVFITEAYMSKAINTWFVLVLIGSLLHPNLRDVAYLVRGAIRWQKEKLKSLLEICRLKKTDQNHQYR